jgi:hypothetical protein
MNRAIPILLACALLAVPSGPVFGDIPHPDALPVDFLLRVDVSVEGGDDYAKAARIVDTVCRFRLETTEPGADRLRYDISLYRDGKLVRTLRNRPLPMTLKRSYRGIADGDYDITFVAKDDVGRIGKGGVTLRVRHGSE